MIKFVLSDLDGTLVPNSRNAASERSCAAIDAIRAHGIEFGCATGRSVSDAIMHFSFQDRYVKSGIYGNGKQVLVRGEQVRDMPYPHDLVERLAEEFTTIDFALLVAFVTGLDPEHPDVSAPCSMVESPEKVQRVLEYYFAPGRNSNLWDGWRSLDQVPDEPIYCLGALLAHGQEDVERFVAYVDEHFSEMTVLNSAPGWFDISMGTMTKATPFPEFLAASGYALDEIVFLADSENDLELMSQIPNSVCVANAMPSVVQRARWMIPSDIDDGPAQLMEALVKTDGDLEAAVALLG